MPEFPARAGMILLFAHDVKTSLETHGDAL
jgi:hypothetical protein